MDIENKLKEFYFSLTPQKQRELVEWMGRINLATNINKDPEFLHEALQPLFEQYPFIKDAFDGQIKELPKTNRKFYKGKTV